MKKRDPYFDNAKLILIFFVVFGHFIQPFISSNGYLEDIYFLIFTFHMPSFVLISGFFSKKINKPNFVVNQMKKLVVPYVIFQVIYSLFYYVIQMKENLSVNLLNPEWSLWFLLSLFYWNISLKLFSRFKPIVGMSLAISLSLLAGYLPNVDNFLSLSRTIVFFPFFLAGYYLTPQYFDKVKSRRKKGMCLLFITTTVLFISKIDSLNKYWFFGSQPYDHFLENPDMGALVRILVYLISFMAIYVFFTLVPQREYKFTYLGRNTLYTYLLHGFFVKGLRAIGVEELDFSMWLLISIFLLSLSLTVLLSAERVKRRIKPIVEVRYSPLTRYKKVIRRG